MPSVDIAMVHKWMPGFVAQLINLVTQFWFLPEGVN
jgi:hypothetical protein